MYPVNARNDDIIFKYSPKPLLTPGIKIIFIIPKPGHTFFGAGMHRQRDFFSGALILAHQKNSGVMRFRIVLRIA